MAEVQIAVRCGAADLGSLLLYSAISGNFLRSLPLSFGPGFPSGSNAPDYLHHSLGSMGRQGAVQATKHEVCQSETRARSVD